jgi:hypothetical protein
VIFVSVADENPAQNTYCQPVRLRSLSTTEVAQSPRGIAKHAQLAPVTNQVQERTKSSSLQHEISALRTVTSNVTKRPHRLLSNIWFMAAEKFDEYWHSSSLNNNLGLLSGARGNVGESPSRFELYECMWRS